MNILSNERLLSLIDQGIASVINFLHVWMVAKYTTPDILASYVLVFGLGFLILRVHAALVTMPLAIISRESSDKHNEILARYHGLHLFFMIFFAIFSLLFTYSYSVITGFEHDVLSYWLISIVLVLNISYEYIRRTLLNYYAKWLSVLFNSFFGALLIGGIAFVINDFEINIQNIFFGFSIAVLFSNIIWLYLISVNSITFPTANEIKKHVIKEWGVLLNNLSQWGAGQGIYYIVIALSSSGAVAVLAVLRNLFGPLNIILLSLEGFLPKMLSKAYNSGGKSALNEKVRKELILIVLLMTALTMTLLYFGTELIGLIYDEIYSKRINNLLILCFIGIYLFAFLSRIMLCALRVLGKANISGVISVIGLIVVLGVSTITVKEGGEQAAAIAMVLSEGMMVLGFIYYFRRYTSNGT